MTKNCHICIQKEKEFIKCKKCKKHFCKDCDFVFVTHKYICYWCLKKN